MKTYTIGEIFRMGLFKGWDGKPYKNKITVSRIVKQLDFKTIQTKYGPAKALTMDQINKYNKKMEKLMENK